MMMAVVEQLKKNQEYGGYFKNGKLKTVMSKVANPMIQNTITMTIEYDGPTFHTHPSGTYPPLNTANRARTGSHSTIGMGKPQTHHFSQLPSDIDLMNAGNNINLLIQRGSSSNKVLFYNSSGVQATMPLKYFVNPKIPKKKK